MAIFSHHEKDIFDTAACGHRWFHYRRLSDNEQGCQTNGTTGHGEYSLCGSLHTRQSDV